MEFGLKASQITASPSPRATSSLDGREPDISLPSFSVLHNALDSKKFDVSADILLPDDWYPDGEVAARDFPQDTANEEALIRHSHVSAASGSLPRALQDTLDDLKAGGMPDLRAILHPSPEKLNDVLSRHPFKLMSEGTRRIAQARLTNQLLSFPHAQLRTVIADAPLRIGEQINFTLDGAIRPNVRLVSVTEEFRAEFAPADAHLFQTLSPTGMQHAVILKSLHAPESFLSEFCIPTSLPPHPGIVPILHGYSSACGTQATILMPRYDFSLDRWLELKGGRGSMAEADWIPIVLSLLETLSFLHESRDGKPQIVHGSIKVGLLLATLHS